MLWKLRPGGEAGVVLANGSMSSNTSGEGQIREAMVRGDAVEAMVALPGQLFLNTQIPVCLWFLANDKTQRGRDRRGETLFIDARQITGDLFRAAGNAIAPPIAGKEAPTIQERITDALTDHDQE